MFVKLRKLPTQKLTGQKYDRCFHRSPNCKAINILFMCRDERTRGQKISVVLHIKQNMRTLLNGTLYKVLLLLSHIRTKTNQDQSFSHAFSSWHMSRNVRMGKFSLFFQMWGNVFPNLLGAKKNWMFMVMREAGEWARILERFVTLMTPFADDNSINSNLCASHTKIQHQQQN